MDFNTPPTTPTRSLFATPKNKTPKNKTPKTRERSTRRRNSLTPDSRGFHSPGLDFGSPPRKKEDFYQVPLGPAKMRKHKRIRENMEEVVAKKILKIQSFVEHNIDENFSDIKGYGDQRNIQLPVEPLQEMFGLLRKNNEYFSNWIDINGNSVEFKPKVGEENSHEANLLNVQILSSHTHPNKKRPFNPPSANDIRAMTEKLRNSKKSIVIASHLVFVPKGIYVFSIHPWLAEQSYSQIDHISNETFEELDWLSGAHPTTEKNPQIDLDDYIVTMGRLGVHVRFYSVEELDRQDKPTLQIFVQTFD